jgi:Extensin-like protein C-terminus
MRRRAFKWCIATALVLTVAGCGLFRWEKRAPWRDDAERACLASKQVQITDYVEPARGIDGPGACGMIAPLKVTAFAQGTVSVQSRQTFACPMLPAIDRWIAESIQPAAMFYFGQPIVAMRAGSYACRNKNNAYGGSLSEHSFGNALDVMAFEFADGRTITISKGWKGDLREQEFLREVFIGSCRIFSTVLGPGADPYHYDHFHLDLARHAGGRTICKPVLKFMPNLDPAKIKPYRPAAPMATTPAPMHQATPSLQHATPRPAPHAAPLATGPMAPAPMAPLPMPAPGGVPRGVDLGGLY